MGQLAFVTWSDSSITVAWRFLLWFADTEEVTMSTTINGAPGPTLATPTSKTRERVRKILLACGPLSALAYIGWHELAALRWEATAESRTLSASCI
jgi:hypothetical protein